MKTENRQKYLNARNKRIGREKPPPKEKKVEKLKTILEGHKESPTFSGENICYTIIKSDSRVSTIKTIINGIKKGEHATYVFHIKNTSNSIETTIKVKAPLGKRSINYTYFFKRGDKVSVTVEYDEPLKPKGVWLSIEGY